MKNKKKAGIIFAVIVVIVVAACLIIQFVIKQEDKKLQKKSEIFETLTTTTKSGTEIETEYTTFNGGSFYIKIPTAFQRWGEDTIAQKYSGDLPDFVFSNEESTVNIAVSLTDSDMSDRQIKPFQKLMENNMKTQGEILQTDYYEVDGCHVGKITLITPAADTDIYNNMIFFSYDEKLVIVTFNCTVELQEEWQEVGDFIIDSLFFGS